MEEMLQNKNKLDANDKTAVEADLNALKDLIAKCNPEEMTDAQVADLKAAQEIGRAHV